MKLIILDPRRGVSRTIPLPQHWYLLVAAVLLLLPAGGMVGGYLLFSAQSPGEAMVGSEAAHAWRDKLLAQKAAVAEARTAAEERLKALTLRVAEMQARLLRLDALGERLARTTRLNKGEFDFSRPPPVGGPEEGAEEGAASAAFARQDFVTALDELMARIDEREAQLKVLESLLAGGRLREESFLAGNPVQVGYLSSTFGRRIDPFHGTLAFHKGIDFAGPSGSDIVATGGGIVLFAGSHPAYGEMVEVGHGDGISTLYAHASKVLVRAGDIIQEGQVIAKLGSTGRSTGPHVHYEVRRNGVPINPATYVASAREPPGGG